MSDTLQLVVVAPQTQLLSGTLVSGSTLNFFQERAAMSDALIDCCRLAFPKEVESVERLRQAEAYRTFRLAFPKEVESVARLRQAEAYRTFRLAFPKEVESVAQLDKLKRIEH